jgi:uncharacterized protein YqeY
MPVTKVIGEDVLMTSDETSGMTSGLKQRLRDDMVEAMRSRDELRTSTLRMAMTAVTNEEVAGKASRTLSEEEVVGVLRREAKKRREAAEAFRAGARPELAERELAEERVLAAYLPAQLADEELTAMVAAAVAEVVASGAEGPRAMGSVMKLVQPQIGGRADGGRVAAEVRSQLGMAD